MRYWLAAGVTIVLANIAQANRGSRSLLTVSPPAVTSREEVQLRFVIRSPGVTVGAGAEVQIQLPISATEPDGGVMWTPPQTGAPAEPGFVAATGPEGAEVAAIGERDLIGARLVSGAFGPEDSLVVTYRGRAQAPARSLMLRARARRSASGPFHELPVNPPIRVEPGDAMHLQVVAPADVVVEEPFTLRIAAVDSFGNLATDFAATLEVVLDAGGETRWVLQPDPSDSGAVELQDVSVSSPGWAVWTVSSPELGVNRSIATRVHEYPPLHRRYFGDTHFHTGSGTGGRGWDQRGGDHRANYTTADEGYRYARDVSGLDWASAAEHEVGLTDVSWADCQEAADRWNTPGRFTTFFAYEWNSHTLPHRIVAYRERGGGVFHHLDARYDTFSELARAVGAASPRGLLIPHVHGANPQHPIWDIEANDVQPVGEIYSTQNSTNTYHEDHPTLFEGGIEDRWSYQYAWARGHRIGIIGSSDDHYGMPGRDGRGLHPERGSGGLAVVVAEANTRDAIWEALEARRTYATTGARIHLGFEIEGVPMGGIVRATPGPLTVDASVGGTGPIAEVELVSEYGGLVDAVVIGGGGEQIVETRITVMPPEPPALYYVRMVQEDGERAWSSPIWVLPAQ